MFPKGIGKCIMNLLKTLAWKVILLLMIAINMLKLLKVLFSYKHVNFCGALRPCEKNHIKEEYCIDGL
jgi:hypothetical protein